MSKIALIKRKKKIALIAHNNKKQDMMEWAKYNIGTLEKHQLYATGDYGQDVGEGIGFRHRHLGVWTIGRRLANRRMYCKG